MICIIIINYFVENTNRRKEIIWNMKKLLILSLLFGLIISSCNPWKFIGEHDKNVDFQKFKTFGLLSWDKHNDEVVKPETKEYILMSIKAEMEKRGYVYQENNADLMISIFVIVQEKTSYSAYANHYAGYAGYGGVAVGVGVGSSGVQAGAYGYGVPTYPYSTVKHDYNVGTLIIDILDGNKKKVVWQGVAQGRVKPGGVTESQVYKDMSKLFKTFPVKKEG